MKQKILSLLVLLMTAASGAWAEDHEYVDLGLPSGTLWATCNVGATSPEQNGSFFALGEVEPKTTYTRNNYKWGTNPAETSTLTKYCDSDGLNTLLPEDDAATVNWGDEWCMPTRAQVDELIANCTVTTTTLNGKDGYLYTSNINGKTLFFPNAGYVDDANGTWYGNNERAYYWTSTAYEEYEPGKKGGWMHYNWNGIEGIKTKPACRGCGMPVRPVFNKDAVPVTTNKAENETSFTQATFAMPAFDATVNYEIVRDLSVKASVNIIIGEGQEAETLTKDSRLRIALDDNNSYQPVSALSCSLTDSIENNEEIAMDDFADAKLIPQFYLKGENDTWTLVTDFNTTTGLPSNLQPGQVYAITLAADEGSAYDGETAPSFTITLFEGYEMEIAAGEYATFYKDEALYIEDENAVIYTISSIEGDKAYLSDAITVAPAETPILIFNAGSEKKNFVIIPAEEGTEADDVEATPEFKGTLVDKEMPASTSTTSYYICNKHDFVWVRNAGTIAANRCWLEISNSNARAVNIVFGDEATSIKNLTPTLSEGEGAWYDLNGRKLNGMPTRKGVYILNGKKTVIK